jgi:hypothetical protein
MEPENLTAIMIRGYFVCITGFLDLVHRPVFYNIWEIGSVCLQVERRGGTYSVGSVRKSN